MKKHEDIITLLDKIGVEYELSEHEPAYTSKQAEEVTGHPASCGAKSIVIKVDDRFVLVVVRGTNMIDFNKLRKHFGIRKARLATPGEVLEMVGVEIGACYPFPAVAGLEGIVDESLSDCEYITFSAGTIHHQVRIKWDNYFKAAEPTLVNIAKQPVLTD